MPAALAHQLRNFIINFINTYLTISLRLRLLIISVFFLIIIFTFLPGFLFHFFFDKNKFGRQIQQTSGQNKVVFSSDGIITSWFGNIIMYNARISEAVGQQPLVTISELRIIPDIFKSTLQKKIIPSKIILKDARWKYLGKENNFSREFQNRLKENLRLNSDFNIILFNNIVTLVFERKNYERQIWNIVIDRGFIRSKKNQTKIFLHYKDIPWGKGDLTFWPALCDTCDLLHGKYKITLEDLPVNRISWFFEFYKLNNGFLDLKSDMEYSPAASGDEIIIKSKIHLQNFMVSDLSDNPIIENPDSVLEIQYKDHKREIQSEFSGHWANIPFRGKVTSRGKNILPESFFISIDNRKTRNLPLLYGYRMEGFKTLDFHLNEDPEGKIFRIINGNLLADKASIFDSQNQELFQIPLISLNLDRNHFNIDLSLKKNKSDARFRLSGTLFPVAKTIETQLEFDDYRKNETVLQNNVIYETSETGKIESENIFWQDIQPVFQKSIKWWKDIVTEDQYKGWRPSIFRERVWVQKYLLRTNLDNEISIKNWQVGETEKTNIPVTGALTLKNSIFDFLLNSNNQKFQITVDMNNNSPALKGKYLLNFSKPESFSAIWLPAGLVSKFSESTIEGEFSSSGDHPYDIVNNFNADYKIFFRNAILNHDGIKSSETWKALNFDLKKIGEKMHLNLNGENENVSISGWGSPDEGNKFWNLKTTLVQKLQLIKFFE